MEVIQAMIIVLRGPELLRFERSTPFRTYLEGDFLSDSLPSLETDSQLLKLQRQLSRSHPTPLSTFRRLPFPRITARRFTH